jgi:hypothetical protein
VSLPCHHEGGQLIVRHAGHSVTFDWGAVGSDDKINKWVQWAAFYSDCEHEVLEVTDGHRITLTYNLFYALGVGDLAGNSPAMGVNFLPLYKKVKEALEEPSFMEKGGPYLFYHYDKLPNLVQAVYSGFTASMHTHTQQTKA